MKNADMPAMPLTGDAYDDFAAYDGTSNTSYNPQCQGVTKRERFAMAAMQGLLSDLTASEAAGYSVERGDVARQSVEMADALLAELERPT